MSQVNVIDHPLIKHKLALIRDKNTEYWLFRYLVKEISSAFWLLRRALRGFIMSTRTWKYSAPA